MIYDDLVALGEPFGHPRPLALYGITSSYKWLNPIYTPLGLVTMDQNSGRYTTLYRAQR